MWVWDNKGVNEDMILFVLGKLFPKHTSMNYPFKTET